MKITLYNILFWIWAIFEILLIAIAVPIGGGFIISALFNISILFGILITCILFYGLTIIIVFCEIRRSFNE